MSLRLVHRTSYIFPDSAVLGPHLVRLRPQIPAKPRIQNFDLRIAGAEHKLHWQSDAFGNAIGRAVFCAPATRLDITADLILDPAPVNPFDFLLSPEAASWPIAYADDEKQSLAAYLSADPAGPHLEAFLAKLPRAGTDTVSFLVDLNSDVMKAVVHERRYEAGTLDPETALSQGRGACRDSSWVLVQALRHKGFAARFVSGYLLKLNEPSGIRAGLHAWAEAYLPGAGWIGLDPSHGLLTSQTHIPLAATPHWRQAAPISGSASLAGELDHEMLLEAV